MPKTKNVALAAATIAACTFGTAGAMIKSLDLTALQIAAFRLTAPVLCVLVIEPRILFRGLRKPRPKSLVASILTVLRIVLWALGFLYAAMSKAICVLFLWPLLLVVMARLFLKEPIPKRNAIIRDNPIRVTSSSRNKSRQ